MSDLKNRILVDELSIKLHFSDVYGGHDRFAIHLLKPYGFNEDSVRGGRLYSYEELLQTPYADGREFITYEDIDSNIPSQLSSKYAVTRNPVTMELLNLGCYWYVNGADKTIQQMWLKSDIINLAVYLNKFLTEEEAIKLIESYDIAVSIVPSNNDSYLQLGSNSDSFVIISKEESCYQCFKVYNAIHTSLKTVNS